jgi:hypothetical protein
MATGFHPLARQQHVRLLVLSLIIGVTDLLALICAVPRRRAGWSHAIWSFPCQLR